MSNEFSLKKLLPHPSHELRLSILFKHIAMDKYLSGEVETELARAAVSQKYKTDTVFKSAVDAVLSGVAELFPPKEAEEEVFSCEKVKLDFGSLGPDRLLQLAEEIEDNESD
jgi:hypothetical protein